MRWYSNGMSTQAVSAITSSFLLTYVETYADVITAVTLDDFAYDRLFELWDFSERTFSFGKLGDMSHLVGSVKCT